MADNDYSTTTARIPTGPPRDLVYDLTRDHDWDDPTSYADRDAATKEAVRGAHLMALRNEVAALWDEAKAGLAKIDITVGSESGDVIQVTVQLQDDQGDNLGEEWVLQCWLSDASKGAPATAAPDSTAWGMGTELEEIRPFCHWQVITNSSGVARLDITEDGADTWYLNVEFRGKIYASDAITFA